MEFGGREGHRPPPIKLHYINTLRLILGSAVPSCPTFSALHPPHLEPLQQNRQRRRLSWMFLEEPIGYPTAPFQRFLSFGILGMT